MKKTLILLPLAALLISAPLAAAESVEERLQRMERLLDSGALVEMQQRLEAMEMENQSLRGELETMLHEVEGLKQRQRELYIDADRRLSRLEREGGAAAPAADAAVPANGGADDAALAAEREAYQQAFELLRDLRYEQAIIAFRDFLKRYPEGRYAHIAQYWLGEASYARRDFKQALVDYQALIDGYGNSPKLAEAMLKIGYCHRELGDNAAARRQLEALVAKYPESTEAGQARSLLKRLPSE